MLLSGRHRKELSEGYKLTTNNRMELMAAIKGLEALKVPGCDVTIYTDSKYVAESVTKKWVFEWEKKGFKKKKNPDLWQRFLKIFRKHNVRIIWIKGHNNNIENERCDKMAVAAYQNGNLNNDDGYSQGQDDLFSSQE